MNNVGKIKVSKTSINGILAKNVLIVSASGYVHFENSNRVIYRKPNLSGLLSVKTVRSTSAKEARKHLFAVRSLEKKKQQKDVIFVRKITMEKPNPVNQTINYGLTSKTSALVRAYVLRSFLDNVFDESKAHVSDKRIVEEFKKKSLADIEIEIAKCEAIAYNHS